MRRKIAKRKRKYILSKGAKILKEEKTKEYFACEVLYLGWHIHSADRDELSAFQGVIESFPVCEEEPRDGGEFVE